MRVWIGLYEMGRSNGAEVRNWANVQPFVIVCDVKNVVFCAGKEVSSKEIY